MVSSHVRRPSRFEEKQFGSFYVPCVLDRPRREGTPMGGVPLDRPGAALRRFPMKDVKPMEKTEKMDVLCELECSQFAEVTGGYQPVWVDPKVLALPFNDHYGAAPSHGIP